MSNSGQIGSAVIGGIIGFMVGGPTGAMYGIQAGLLAGSVFFPTQLPAVTGPRMEDLQTTQAQIGGPVIETWGTIAVPGTVIWLGPVVEVATTEEVGGKGGGPEQDVTTYTYFQPVAVGLRASTHRPIGGILRIWENGQLVYDVRPMQEGEDPASYAARSMASYRYQAGFTLYRGTADQQPDPTIEVVEGVGNVPAFRDLAYVVYHNRQLTDEQARRHPQWRFEIYDGEGERNYIPPTVLPDTIMSSYQIDVILADWQRGLMYFVDRTGGADEEGFRVFRIADNTEIRQQLFTDALAGSARPYPNLSVGNPVVGNFGHIYFPWHTGGVSNVAIARINPDTLVMDAYRAEGGASEFWNEAVALYVPGYGDLILSVSLLGVHFGLYDGYNMGGSAFWTPETGYSQGKVCNGSSPLFPSARGYAIACDGESSGTGPPLLMRRVTASWDPFLLAMDTNDEAVGSIAPADVVPTWTRFSECRVFLFDQYDNTLLIGVEGGEASGGNGSRFLKYDPATQTILWSIDTQLPISNDYISSSRVQNNRIAWLRNAAVTRYFDTRDGSYEDIDWGAESDNSFIGEQVFDGGGNRMITFEIGRGPVVLEFGSPSPGDVALATIVSDVCSDCGLEDSDIDVSDLTTRFVHGYARTRPMPGRSCIEPLRMVGFFDCVESGLVMKWPTRGKAAVATIEADELGAHEGEDAPPAVTTKKLSALELPRAMRVHYMAPSRDYEPGEQISPVRLTTDAVNDVDVDLVAALDDNQAAQIAEIIWADAWRARWVHETAVDRCWSQLEPADAILLPVDGRNERVRIAELTTSDLILKRLALVRDDDGAYESTAVADPPQRQPSRITLSAGTTLLMLDLPALREEDDNAGFYVAAARSGIGTTWSGAVISRSTDGGATWAQVATVANEATVGRVNTSLPAGITSTWDYENAIDVVLPAGRTLESRTEADVLLGANSAAIGVDGRWEIVQFMDAEEIGPNRYRLTTLLRGRRGTEHLVGTSQINDYFVLVSGAGIVRVPLSTAQIGVSMLYRGVTFGTSFTSATAQAFTGNGMALETFSPVFVRGERDSSEDLSITWIRRDRLHQTMRSGVELPNSEASESYSIDILDGSSVVRTLTSSTPSVVYAAADQTTDFGAPQSEVTVRIYQLSAIVGRGTPAEATI